MDFLFYCRDKPGSTALLHRNVEAHWSFMDDYADRLLVRGPTMTADGETHTGSLHIVELADPAETETFAYQEPFYRAGAYSEVMVRRWHDRLGRTMRDDRGDREEAFFLILAHAMPGSVSSGSAPPAPPHDLAPQHRERIAAYGWTQSLDGTQWTGFAAIVPMSALDVVNALLAQAPWVAGVELHRWRIGGRR